MKLRNRKPASRCKNKHHLRVEWRRKWPWKPWKIVYVLRCWCCDLEIEEP